MGCAVTLLLTVHVVGMLYTNMSDCRTLVSTFQYYSLASLLMGNTSFMLAFGIHSVPRRCKTVYLLAPLCAMAAWGLWILQVSPEAQRAGTSTLKCVVAIAILSGVHVLELLAFAVSLVVLYRSFGDAVPQPPPAFPLPVAVVVAVDVVT